MTPRTIALVLSILLALAGTQALAHGEKAQDGHDMSSEIDREQRAWGVAAAPDEATRIVEVSMSDDMRFTPASIAVKQGETVTFKISNEGKIQHEFVLGTQSAIEEHAAMMKKHPNMEHAEAYMVHVSPGQSGNLTWTFNLDGTIQFACLIPGHFEAGMVGQVDVLTTRSN